MGQGVDGRGGMPVDRVVGDGVGAAAGEVDALSLKGRKRMISPEFHRKMKQSSLSGGNKRHSSPCRNAGDSGRLSDSARSVNREARSRKCER